MRPRHGQAGCAGGPHRIASVAFHVLFLQALLTSIGRMGSRLRAGNYSDSKLIEVSRLTFVDFEGLISFVTELKWHAKIEA